MGTKKLIGQLEQTYDEDGFLILKQLPEGKVYAYTYNTLGALTQVTLPDGTTIEYPPKTHLTEE